MAKKLLVWLNEIDKNDHYFVGEKAAVLGEVLKEDIPVLPGFVITSAAFSEFVKANNLHEKILHVKGTGHTQEALEQFVRKEVTKAKLPEELTQDIFSAYTILGGPLTNETITLSESSSAHGKAISLRGEANLILSIKELWATYLTHNPYSYSSALLVQLQPHLEKEAILSTTHQDGHKFLIQVAINNTSYSLPKEDTSSSSHEQLPFSLSQQNELRLLAKKIEAYFYFPQEVRIGWAKETTYVLNIKPLTLSTSKPLSVEHQRPFTTATRLYIATIDEALAVEMSKRQTDGMGYFLADHYIQKIGIHPKKLLREGSSDSLTNSLISSLREVAKVYSPRPVIYALSNLTTDTYLSLQGGKEYEVHEPHAYLGYRGAYRHLSDGESLQLELDVIKQVRNKEGCKNVWIMLPFVRSVEELRLLKQAIASHSLYRTASFKMWMSIDTPAACNMLEEYIACGIDGIAINFETLSSLLLGIDTRNPEMSSLMHPSDPAIQKTLAQVIKTAQAHSLTTSLYNAPLLDTDLLETVLTHGITSLIVEPRHFQKVREHIARIEKELLSKKVK